MKRGLTLIISIILFSLAFAVTPALSPEKARVIVVFKEKPTSKDIEFLKAQGAIMRYNFTIIPGVVIEIPQQAIDRITLHWPVKYVEEDKPVYALAKPAPSPQPPQETPWGITRVGAPDTWASTKGTGIKVAILDTGIDYKHPDLDANVKGGITYWGKDFKDKNGHGTHVSGTVGAENNDIGVVGVAPEVWLYAVKVLNNEGIGFTSDVIAGIEWSVNNGIKVISMSFGSSGYSQSLKDACDSAYAQGLLLVAAAGNEGDGDPNTNEYSYPAAYDSVIAVGAVDINNVAPSWSNSGPYLELVAPGVGIKSTWLNGGYNTISGTSMACPHVTGTIALIWVKNSTLSNIEIRTKLQQTATDLGPVGWDPIYGYGLVNAAAACA